MKSEKIMYQAKSFNFLFFTVIMTDSGRSFTSKRSMPSSNQELFSGLKYLHGLQPNLEQFFVSTASFIPSQTFLAFKAQLSKLIEIFAGVSNSSMSAPHNLSDKTLDEGRCFFVCYNKKGGLYINKLFSKKYVHHLLIVWECEQVSRNVKLGQNVQKNNKRNRK